MFDGSIGSAFRWVVFGPAVRFRSTWREATVETCAALTTRRRRRAGPKKEEQKERKKERKEGAWTYESTGVKVNVHGPRPCRCRYPAELRAGPPLARPPGGAACRERRSAGTRAWGTSSRDKMRVRGEKRRRAQTSVKKEHSLCRFISQGQSLWTKSIR